MTYQFSSRAIKTIAVAAATAIVLVFFYEVSPSEIDHPAYFSPAETQAMTFALRMFHSMLILAVAYYLYRCANAVDNERLTVGFWKASIFVCSFFIARATASVLDNTLASAIGWFSNIVPVVFWAILIYKVRSVCIILESPRNNALRVSLRKDIDSMIARIEKARANAHELRQVVDKVK